MDAPREGWNSHWRDTVLSALDEATADTESFELIVIGGGITGAGIFREAARNGMRVLLVEQRDFAWGTSSRSSKMVHGGLRYLASGALGLTRESVRERQRFLTEAPGLVDPLPFLYPHYRGAFPPPWLFRIVLSVYDLLAGIWNHRFLRADALAGVAPGLRQEGLLGAMQFADAVTDDARLTLRAIREGMHDGGLAVNYVTADQVKQLADGAQSVSLTDTDSGKSFTVRGQAVVNATGAWADKLRAGTSQSIRPLRGSHLVFPAALLPMEQAISFRHPRDKRPVFVFPWEGVSVLGTTDLDHAQGLDAESSITEEEVDYLLEASHYQLPQYPVSRADVLSTWSGVRPVISSGKGLDPSKEKREHSIWQENGLISVSGGKLTTFRVIAQEILQLVKPDANCDAATRFYSVPPSDGLFGKDMSDAVQQRLAGRLGPDLTTFAEQTRDDEMRPVEDTRTLWAELRWALRNECVVHLDDLLLRRTRLGSLLARGGEQLIDEVLALCAEEMHWDAQRCADERQRYLDIWARHYSLPADAV